MGKHIKHEMETGGTRMYRLLGLGSACRVLAQQRRRSGNYSRDYLKATIRICTPTPYKQPASQRYSRSLPWFSGVREFGKFTACGSRFLGWALAE